MTWGRRFGPGDGVTALGVLKRRRFGFMALEMFVCLERERVLIATHTSSSPSSSSSRMRFSLTGEDASL